MTHPDASRVPMNMTEKAFLAAVGHSYGATCAEREQAAMNLQADVLARSKGAADAA